MQKSGEYKIDYENLPENETRILNIIARRNSSKFPITDEEYRFLLKVEVSEEFLKSHEKELISIQKDYENRKRELNLKNAFEKSNELRNQIDSLRMKIALTYEIAQGREGIQNGNRDLLNAIFDKKFREIADSVFDEKHSS